MAGSEDRTYTEAEHEALMAHAVQHENASLASAKVELETKVTELTGKVAALEAEKATLEVDKSTAEKALADYTVKVERAAQVEALKSERARAIKDANPALPETHFTPERILAWAEMPNDTFDVVVESIKAAAGTPVVVKESAAFKGGEANGNVTGSEKSPARGFLTVGKEI